MIRYNLELGCFFSLSIALIIYAHKSDMQFIYFQLPSIYSVNYGVLRCYNIFITNNFEIEPNAVFIKDTDLWKLVSLRLDFLTNLFSICRYVDPVRISVVRIDERGILLSSRSRRQWYIDRH